MLFKAYKRVLLGISISISLLLLASPASAMCFYNKMNPSDYLPKGYHASQSDKTVGFVFRHDGIHLPYKKNVSINQHQCIGGGGSRATVRLAFLGFHSSLATEQNVDPHGYVVVETKPSSLSTASVKYFKFRMKVYSKSNALKGTFKLNLACKVDPGSIKQALLCYAI